MNNFFKKNKILSATELNARFAASGIAEGICLVDDSTVYFVLPNGKLGVAALTGEAQTNVGVVAELCTIKRIDGESGETTIELVSQDHDSAPSLAYSLNGSNEYVNAKFLNIPACVALNRFYETKLATLCDELCWFAGALKEAENGGEKVVASVELRRTLFELVGIWNDKAQSPISQLLQALSRLEPVRPELFDRANPRTLFELVQSLYTQLIGDTGWTRYHKLTLELITRRDKGAKVLVARTGGEMRYLSDTNDENWDELRVLS